MTSLVGAILMRNPEPLPREVPKPLQNVISRALAKDANIRYKSAAEMRTDLRNPQNSTDPNFQLDKSVYTVQIRKLYIAARPFIRHLKRKAIRRILSIRLRDCCGGDNCWWVCMV